MKRTAQREFGTRFRTSFRQTKKPYFHSTFLFHLLVALARRIIRTVRVRVYSILAKIFHNPFQLLACGCAVHFCQIHFHASVYISRPNEPGAACKRPVAHTAAHNPEQSSATVAALWPLLAPKVDVAWQTVEELEGFDLSCARAREEDAKLTLSEL